MYQTYKAADVPDVGRMGTGWLPPLPDLRDYTEAEPEIAEMAKKLGLAEGKGLKALQFTAAPVDLRAWCSPIENQGMLGSCTAHAGVGVVEYLQRRATRGRKHIDGSRNFVYYNMRKLAGLTGDSGGWLRTTMAALVLAGVPHEKYHPYTDGPGFDIEPPSWVYAVADNYEALRYFSHDPLGAPGERVLASVKKYLAAGIPSMFGFWGFPSAWYCDVSGGIPYPCPREYIQWGHAVVAVGYDDTKKLTNLVCKQTTTGALLFRNSWGTGWGEKGYGWLPYDYVLKGLALDFWSLLCMEYVDTGEFGL